MKNLKFKFNNKKIFIYGLARSGLATLKFFKKRKNKIICWDDDITVRKNIEKKYLLKSKKKIFQSYFDFIIISPGIDIKKCQLSIFLKKNVDKIITDLDVFFHFNKPKKIISITGTNGKSTTCKLLSEVFSEAGYDTQLIGNIGKPILSSRKPSRKTIFIFEISSYQLQYTKNFRSNRAALLNISPDHIERHGTMKRYIYTKAKIFNFQTFRDKAYLNLNNKFTTRITKIFKKNKFKSKINKVNERRYKKFFNKIENKYLLSENNLQNISFVIKIAKSYNLKNEVILKVFNKFKCLPHRQENLRFSKKIICINDSKATSFESSSQSLRSYKNIFWILGGLPKMHDKFFINKFKNNIIKAYIIGNHINFFKKQLKKKIDFYVARYLKKAVLKIIEEIKKKQKLSNNIKYTMLFSPAAASFDQFKNFEDRGNEFKKLIFKMRSNIN